MFDIRDIRSGASPEFIVRSKETHGLARLLGLDQLPFLRRRLVCHWRREDDGQLACHWEVDLPSGEARGES